MSYRKEKSYTYDDMLKAFEAGERCQENFMKIELSLYEDDEDEDDNAPDFDVWIDEFTNKD